MKVIRVFPEKTRATPDDGNVRINLTPTLFDEADEIHISVAFTWHKKKAEWLADQWKVVAPVKIGGPAYNEPGIEFIPGMYMKKGYVITSRGCNNRCWFCSVPKREGYQIRELPITNGWILTDDNLLACSKEHINNVFEMLSKQPNKPEFVGGLEAKLLTKEYAEKLKTLKPECLFFAYDTPDDLEPLIEAGKLLKDAGFRKTSHNVRAYVLIGYKGDTFEKAQKRMKEAWEAGFFPMAMLYRDEKGDVSKEWKRFQREWANPIITACNIKKYFTQ